MSGTKFEVTGAVHGPGIYLGVSKEVSNTYNRIALNKWNQTELNINSCLLVGEFIIHEHLYDFKKYPDNMRIARDEKYFIPRYFICSKK